MVPNARVRRPDVAAVADAAARISVTASSCCDDPIAVVRQIRKLKGRPAPRRKTAGQGPAESHAIILGGPYSTRHTGVV